MRNHQNVLMLAVMVALASMTAVAEEQTAHSKLADELPEVNVQADAPNEIRYKPKRASTATKTDADIMDIPQVVNVVPQQVLIDQQARSLDDAIKKCERYYHG